MKKKNLYLVAGVSILIALIFTMSFPQVLTDINPYGVQNIRSWEYENGELNLQAPPFPPSSENPLGTDEMGRDILTFIIYGTKLTLTISLFVVIGRFLLALPLGVAAGFGSYTSKLIIEQCSIIFSALPALLIGVIILKMNFFTNLYKEQSIAAFVLVLTVVDWAKLGKMIMERVQETLAKPFIKGEIAIGKSRLQITLENVIPHLTAELVILFFMEIARVLTMMMQFGVFGVFVGNMGFVADTEGGQTVFLNTSYEPEWASMLGSARNFIRTAPWTVIFPGIAFFISILGFNLIGEGLRREFQERNSAYLTNLRGILSFEKVKLLGRQMKGMDGKQKLFIGGSIFCMILLAGGAGLWKQQTTAFRYIDGKDVFTLKAFDEVLIGTDEGKAMAENIADAFKEIGLKPLSEKGYISEYHTEDIYIPTEVSLKVVSHTMKTEEYIHGKDFVFQSYGDRSLKGELYDATKMELLSIEDFTEMRDRFVLLDSSIYSEKGFQYLIRKMMTESDVNGILCILPPGKTLPYPMGNEVYNGVVMWVTSEAGHRLQQMGGSDVQILLKSRKLESIGRNVAGMVPGKDSMVGEEAIMIGIGYNYDEKHKAIGYQRVLMGIELAKKLSAQNNKDSRTIIIVFWDGTLSNLYNGKGHYGKAPLYHPEKSELYVDLTKIDAEKGQLYYNNRQAPITRYFSFTFNHQLEKALEKRNIVQHGYKVDISPGARDENYMDKVLYYEANTPTIIISIQDGIENSNKVLTLDGLGQILYETIIKNNH